METADQTSETTPGARIQTASLAAQKEAKGNLRAAVETWANQHFANPKFDDTGERSSFGFPHKADGIELQVFVDTDDARFLLSVYAFLKLHVSMEKRGAINALLGRLSPELMVGAIELAGDLVRFRASFNLENTTPSVTTIENQVRSAIARCRDIAPAVIAVLSGQTPEAALAALGVPGAIISKPARPDGRAEPIAKWLDDAAPLHGWKSFDGSSLIQEWAQQLPAALPDGVPADPLCERAVVFVGSGLESCENMARLVAREARYQFAFVPGEQVIELSEMDLESFKYAAPIVVFLQAGTWAQRLNNPNLDAEARASRKAFQARLLRAFKNYDPTRPVVYATSESSLGSLEDSLTNAGAFDQAFGVPEPSPVSRGGIFIDLIGRERCGPSMLAHPGKVGKALKLAFRTSEGLKLAALHLRRRAAREHRKVEFIDLVEFYTRDFIQVAPASGEKDPMRGQVATHEAGHAVISVLDSPGLDVPDFCSIIPSGQMKGVVVSSVVHRYDAVDLTTYETFRHSVRVSLAGRAAEELVYGSVRVTGGASSDLANATQLARWAFGELGFAPGMENATAGRSNLAVVGDTPTEIESAYLNGLVRQFLADEYTHVIDELRKNRAFLESVRDRLLVDPVLDRHELIEICTMHQIAASVVEEG